ncbi:hypothetical protein BH20ACT7_BH20ACT7_09190 [soil metagenome]
MTRDVAPEGKTAADRVRLPLDPEEALRALLAVDPDAPPADDEEERTEGEQDAG